MRIILATIASIFISWSVSSSAVSATLQQQFGFDTSSASICAMDRTVPTPICIALGRVDSTRHVIAAAGGIDIAGAVCDGTTDDRVAIETAASALSAKGGTIRLPPGRLCYLSGLTLPANVTLDGGFRLPDNPYGSNSVAAYATLGGIALSPSGTIALGANAAVQNVFIKRAGMTFPAADTSAFAGTAITFAGADGPRISNVMTVGFNTCVGESGFSVSRYRIEGLYCHGINGEMINLPSWDSSIIRDVHNWPFAAQPYTTCPALTTTGHGLHLAGAQDDTTVDNVLSLGYARGFWLGQTGSISMGKIWADYPAGCALSSGSVGVWIDTYTTGVLIDQLWAWSSEQGVVLNMTAGAKLKVSSLFVANTTGDGVSIAGGDLHASMAEFKLIGGHAYSIGSAASHLYSRGTAETVSGATLVAAGSSIDPNNLDVVFMSDKADGLAVFPDNLVPTSVASGTAINLPINARSVTVTGTANINRLNGTWGGRAIRLRFADAAVVYPTDNIVLATPVFVGAAGRFLDLVFDAASAKWVETARGPASAVITDLSASTASTVAAASTVYLGANGAQSTDAKTRWAVGRAYAAVTMTASTDAAPGTSQTYTYTLMRNGTATSSAITISGSATTATGTAVVAIAAGDQISCRVTTSSGAAATLHRCVVELTN